MFLVNYLNLTAYYSRVETISRKKCWLHFERLSVLEKIFGMQKGNFKTICFKKKFDHASYILHSFEIEIVFDLYFRQICKKNFHSTS